MFGRRYYLPGPGLLRRLVGWAFRHPIWAVWLFAAATIVAERGW